MLGLLCYNRYMATSIYSIEYINLIDDTVLEITPLKIKYMRQFMDAFQEINKAKDDIEAIGSLVECTRIAMKQYMPSFKTTEDVEDNISLPEIYKLMDYSAGVKFNENSDKEFKEQKQEQDKGNTWEDLDLAKLESEAFLLGIWKDFDELERSMSMPELLAVLGEKRELDYSERKFLAAIQGVDLDKHTSTGPNGGDPWEEMKARVFSKGKAKDANDIVSYQGSKASKAGFGIGMGLDYADMTSQE